ncbi:hypothetical protein GGR57DRAFT_393107 [Xylariaceae sp. FL1272]|nr:hypothetical protein GGR57DRAFT_393107 [Xylariaceae sp. FL1272]
MSSPSTSSQSSDQDGSVDSGPSDQPWPRMDDILPSDSEDTDDERMHSTSFFNYNNHGVSNVPTFPVTAPVISLPSRTRSMPDVSTTTQDEVSTMADDPMQHRHEKSPQHDLPAQGATGLQSSSTSDNVSRFTHSPPHDSAPHNAARQTECSTSANKSVQTVPTPEKKHVHYCPVKDCYHSVLSNQIHIRPMRRGTVLPQQHTERSSNHLQLRSRLSSPSRHGDAIQSLNSKIRYRVTVWSTRQTSCTEFRGLPLDLESERANGVGSGHGDPVMDVETVIQSTKADGEGMLKSTPSEIIKDPRYDMEIAQIDIIIYSPRIIAALKDVLGYYPGVNLSDDSVRFPEPYCFIIHHMEKIKKLMNREFDKVTGVTTANQQAYLETRDHLNVLCQFVETAYGSLVKEEKSRHDEHVARATFKMLWLLFKPGDTVYVKKGDKWQACVVQEVKFQHHSVSHLQGPYSFALWHLDCDGRYLGRRQILAEIAPFDGERDIISLGVVPTEYLDSQDGGQTRRMLEKRGEKWYSYLKGVQVFYKGYSLGFASRWYEGRVMIDAASHYASPREGSTMGRPIVGEINDDTSGRTLGPPGGGIPIPEHHKPMRPGGRPSYDMNNSTMPGSRPTFNASFVWRHYDRINPKTVDSLQKVGTGEHAQHMYLLCPTELIGFILQSKNWERLSVDNCSPPRMNLNAIDTLVLPEQRKTMIKALVHRYTDSQAIMGKSAAAWSADFIQNKGEGQIFLLHGGPGVGKTYVKCIAESTGRPLLSLTCGDFGSRETVLESRLSAWFQLAEKWGAVMLLDEADIFLERRATSDLKRNSLVTVFLRTMEYYRGILFLATNRVGTFDEAFMSRIHVVIRYDDLDNNDRHKIWSQFLDKLKRERGRDLEIDRQAKKFVLEDSSMVNIPWNGREIRNAIQTAVALADYRFAQLQDKEPDQRAVLEWEDFDKVREMAQAFKGYMYSISEMTEAQKARQAQLRNDAFRDGRS